MDLSVESPVSILRGAHDCLVKSHRRALSGGTRDYLGAMLELPVVMSNDYDDIARRCCGPQ
jgi:hypothetical protein